MVSFFKNSSMSCTQRKLKIVESYGSYILYLAMQNVDQKI